MGVGLREQIDAVGTVVDVMVDGCRMRWRRFGSGRPLVLLHGGHGGWAHWIRNVGPLSVDHAVWVPDMPGFGDSDALPIEPHDPQRLPMLVAALRRALDQLLGAETAFGLVGFSFGGAVAVTLAADDSRVSRLVLVGPGGHGTRRRQREPLADWREVEGTERRVRLRQNLYAFMLSAPAAGEDADAIDTLALDIHAQACERTQFRSRAISMTPLLPQTLDRFRRPVLLIWGSEDVTADPAVLAPTLVADRPWCRWQIVDGAGHWVQFEQAAVVNRLLQDDFATPHVAQA